MVERCYRFILLLSGLLRPRVKIVPNPAMSIFIFAAVMLCATGVIWHQRREILVQKELRALAERQAREWEKLYHQECGEGWKHE
jgi:cell division protein FtsL